MFKTVIRTAATNTRGSFGAWAALSAAVIVSCAAPPAQGPDLILTEGQIYVDGSRSSRVEAIAISGSTIVATGSTEQIRALAADTTQEMLLEDAAVLPGFYDAWLDLEALGRWGEGLNLSTSSTLREVQTRLRASSAGRGDNPSAWIVGWGWDETRWAQSRLPTAADLDAVEQQRPVLLYRRSGRVGWLNSAALRQAGLADDTADTGDSDGGLPLGLVGNEKLAAVESRLPAIDDSVRRGWIIAGLQVAAAAGLTHVATAPVGPQVAALYAAIDREDELPLRVDLRREIRSKGGTVRPATPPLASLRLRNGGLGVVLDGPFSPPLAALERPYANATGSGRLLVQREEVAAICAALADGTSIAFVAHGDLAVETALACDVDSGRRLIVGADLLPATLLQAPGIQAFEPRIAVVPHRLAHDLYWLQARIGDERAKYAHAYARLGERNGLAALASIAPDYPVAPMAALHVTLTRQDNDGYPLDGWHPEQRLSLQHALTAAIAAGHEGRSGVLEPGAPADLVVWSEDPYLGDLGSLLRARALLTMVAGRVVYSRPLVEANFDAIRR